MPWRFAGALCLLLSACTLTSDPRRGGIVSYWVRGEKAYEQRLRRMESIREREAQSAAVQAQATAGLEARAGTRRAELEAGLADIEALDTDLASLERQAAAAPGLDPAVQPALDDQRRAVDALRAEGARAAYDQERIDRLRAEISTLSQRVRLLLETQ